MMLPDKDGLVTKIRELLLKSGLAVGELTRDNAGAIDEALTFVIGKIPGLRFVPSGRSGVRGLLLVAIDTLPKKAIEPQSLSSGADVEEVLAKIRNRIHSLHGEALRKAQENVGYEIDVESDKLARQLDAVDANPTTSAPQRVEVALLKAQLYGCWQKLHGTKRNQREAITCFEAALRISTSEVPDAEAEIRYRYAMFSLHAPKDVGGGKEKAVENLMRAKDVAAPGSELHRKCSEELARHTKKGWSLFG
jgi:hypothetical protein